MRTGKSLARDTRWRTGLTKQLKHLWLPADVSLKQCVRYAAAATLRRRPTPQRQRDDSWKGAMINFVANVHAFALHFFSSGVGVVGRAASGATDADLLAIATAFALAIVAMTYCIGPVFGSRVNPAVTRTTGTRNNRNTYSSQAKSAGYTPWLEPRSSPQFREEQR